MSKKNIIMMQNNTMDCYEGTLDIDNVEYIKFGNYECLLEELHIHDVPKEEIVIMSKKLRDLEDSDVLAIRVLKNDGKYYFYPLCDLYFE